jgi:hypothetical protein
MSACSVLSAATVHIVSEEHCQWLPLISVYQAQQDLQFQNPFVIVQATEEVINKKAINQSINQSITRSIN